MERKFAQTFFLAPQDRGYFVLNDIMSLFPPEGHVASAAAEPAPVMENGYMPHAAFGMHSGPITAQGMASNAAEDMQDAAVAHQPVHAEEAVAVMQAAAPAAEAPAPQQPAASAAAYMPAAPAFSAPALASDRPAANLTWAERTKLQKAQAPGTPQKPAPAPTAPAQPPASPAPVTAPPAKPAPAPAPVQQPAQAQSSDEAPVVRSSRPMDPDSIGVYVRNLPQPNENMTLAQLKELVAAEFSKFGQIRADAAGKEGLSLVNSTRFGYVAYVRYQTEAAMRAAMEQDHKLKMHDLTITILKLAKEFLDGPGGGRGMSGRGRTDGYGRGRGE